MSQSPAMKAALKQMHEDMRTKPTIHRMSNKELREDRRAIWVPNPFAPEAEFYFLRWKLNESRYLAKVDAGTAKKYSCECGVDYENRAAYVASDCQRFWAHKLARNVYRREQPTRRYTLGRVIFVFTLKRKGVRTREPFFHAKFYVLRFVIGRGVLVIALKPSRRAVRIKKGGRDG